MSLLTRIKSAAAVAIGAISRASSAPKITQTKVPVLHSIAASTIETPDNTRRALGMGIPQSAEVLLRGYKSKRRGTPGAFGGIARHNRAVA